MIFTSRPTNCDVICDMAVICWQFNYKCSCSSITKILSSKNVTYFTNRSIPVTMYINYIYDTLYSQKYFQRSHLFESVLLIFYRK